MLYMLRTSGKNIVEFIYIYIYETVGYVRYFGKHMFKLNVVKFLDWATKRSCPGKSRRTIPNPCYHSSIFPLILCQQFYLLLLLDR